MKVEVIDVHGLDIACEAVRLSFNSASNEEGVIASENEGMCIDLYADDIELLKKLIIAGDSHAKVMRMATVWLDLTMPRYWWSEADQCKVGFVTMSESSVHTILKQIKQGKLTRDNFETTPATTSAIDDFINTIKGMVENGASLEDVKCLLPESFLQRRIVCTNYQTLRHIYFDRRNHRLPIWHKFLDEVLEQLPFPDLITIEKVK